MKSTIPLKLNRFFSSCTHLKFKKGEMILRGGENPQGIYFLEKGYTRLYTVSKKGEELTLIIFKPGDIFSYLWAINDTANEYFLESMTASRMRRSSRLDFLKFIEGNPEAYSEIVNLILVRFGGLLSRMEYLVFGNAYSKVASILVICAERFGKKVEKRIVFQLPLTHNDIAKLVGVTRETASIEIKNLEIKGLIEQNKRLFIVKNINKLRKESLFRE